MWINEHIGYIEEKVNRVKNDLEKLDLKGENHRIDAFEEVERMECIKLSRIRCSQFYQRSRSRWLKEGDAITHYFHRCVKKRLRRNDILCVEID